MKIMILGLSGMTPDKPVQLNLLQAATANELANMKLLFSVLAHTLGSAIPTIDFTSYVEKVKEFEEKYTFWDELNADLGKLNKINKDISQALKSPAGIHMYMTETQINIVSGLTIISAIIHS